MASTSVYVCQYCGKQIRLTREEKDSMQVIACEHCRKEYESPEVSDVADITEKAVGVAGSLIGKFADSWLEKRNAIKKEEERKQAEEEKNKKKKKKK